MGQSLVFGVIDDVDMRTIIPANVNTHAGVNTVKLFHTDGISGGVVATDSELVASHVFSPMCVAMGVFCSRKTALCTKIFYACTIHDRGTLWNSKA
jgi:hypothetical protein